MSNVSIVLIMISFPIQMLRIKRYKIFALFMGFFHLRTFFNLK